MYQISDLTGLRSGLKLFIKSPELAKISSTKENYRRFIIQGRTKNRQIEIPSDNLKSIQREILNIFTKYIQFTAEVHGFVKDKDGKRSIKTNAELHLNANVLINLDIKDFFHSITSNRINDLLTNRPFLLDKTIASAITNIATFKHDKHSEEGILPLGSSLSPLLSNLICNGMDRELLHLAKRNDLIYSRYADDLTFSSGKSWIDENIIHEIEKIITNNGFRVNEEKTKLKKRPGTFEVTGLIINNNRLNVKRKYLKLVKAILFNWETKGIKLATAKYLSTMPFVGSRNPEKFGTYKFILAVRGKIEFIGMIRGKHDTYYNRYLNKFYTLKEKSGLDMKLYARTYLKKIDKEIIPDSDEGLSF